MGYAHLRRPTEAALAGLRPAGPARATRLRARPDHSGTVAMTRLFVPAVVAALLVTGGVEAAETVADRVFGAGLLAGVTQPTKLHYSYEMTGQGIDPPLASHVDLDVREVGADGAKA